MSTSQKRITKDVKNNETNNTKTSIWYYVSQQLINVAQRIRIFHWTTKEYHAHKISGKLYKKMNEHIDQITEILITLEQQNHKFIDSNNNYTIDIPTSLSNDRQSMIAFLKYIATQLRSTKENTLAKILTSEPALNSVTDDLLKDITMSTYLMNMNG